MTDPQPTSPTQPDESLHEFDLTVLRSRGAAVIGIIVGLCIDIIIALLYPNRFPVIAASEVALAVGTVALAYASILQVASSVESKRAEDNWRALQRVDRARDRAPNLVFGVRPRRVQRQRRRPDIPILAPASTELAPFDEAELYVENVGPGIAAGLTATLIRLYVVYNPLVEANPQNPDPWSECKNSGELISVEHTYSTRPLGLPSPYLAIGPDNRMRLLNADEWEKWSGSEDLEMDRMYLAIIEFTDIEGQQPKRVAGGLAWAPKLPGWHGEPSDALEEEYVSQSRWYLAASDEVTKILADWTAHQSRPNATGH